VRNGDDIERAFAASDTGHDALTVGLEAVTQAHRKRIAELAAKHRLPAIYGGREFVEAGGLMFYGPSFTEIYRRAATYVDRIFKGAKPADLPVEQPSKFDWSSTAGRQERSGSTFRPACGSAPTRSSNRDMNFVRSVCRTPRRH
jgi:ABC-type uncharacterized transport system substrate-binding protein